MPDFKYLYHALYILINYLFKEVVDIFINEAYYQESYILIMSYNNVVTVAWWLDEGFRNSKQSIKSSEGVR